MSEPLIPLLGDAETLRKYATTWYGDLDLGERKAPPRYRVLLFVHDFRARWKFSPSLREVQVAAGLSSTSVARSALEELRDGGYLSWHQNVSRSLVPLVPRTEL